MNNDVQENIEHSVELESLPIGVSVDGKIIGPPKIFDLAEQHFMDEVEQAKSAVSHELLSMASAGSMLTYALGKCAVTLSPQPLVEGWGNAAAIGLSLPILKTLWNAKVEAQNDLHRVHRVAKHFEEHKDPKILHALAFQLEELADPEPDVCKVDREAYQSDYCIGAPISEQALIKAGARLTADKTQSKSWLGKTTGFIGHVAHDVSDVFMKPKSFLHDVGKGWASVGMQAALVAEHASIATHIGLSNCFDSAAKKMWVLEYQVPEMISDALVGKKKNYVDVFADQSDRSAFVKLEGGAAEETSVDHERHRLQRAKDRLVTSMIGTGTTFPLENGFVTVEAINGLNYLGQGDAAGIAMGVSHIFSAAMGLRPAQLLGHRNHQLLSNYTSERAQAAEEPVEPSV